MKSVTRRQFLGTTGSMALGLQSAPGLANMSDNATNDSQARIPKDVNRKFNADGSVRPFAGNTFVGHIEQQGAGFEGFDTLLNVYREVPKYSFKEKIALLPPSSYHITVFVGVNDEDRSTPRWRDGLDRATPIEKITSETVKLLKGRKKTHYAPFEFIPDDIPPLKIEGTIHIPLKPANHTTEQRLRLMRNELSEITGIRDQDHERYKYHITLGYIHRYLSATEAEQLQKLAKDCMQKVAELKRHIQIPSVDFCRFNDMFAFEVLHRL